MGFFAKSLLWSFAVSVAFADYGGLRGGVETIDANVSEAAPRRLPYVATDTSKWTMADSSYCSGNWDNDNTGLASQNRGTELAGCKTKCVNNPKCLGVAVTVGRTKQCIICTSNWATKHSAEWNTHKYSCGRAQNHWGYPFRAVAGDVHRSCDCEQECNEDIYCRAWTHDGSKTCWLRYSLGQGYADVHMTNGMMSGEKVIGSRIVVVGSSVAKGYYATNLHGWAARLGDVLAEPPWNLELINVANPGDNSEKAKPRLDNALKKYRPGVVIVALGLANQGLTQSKTATNAELVGEQFHNGIHELATIAKAAGAAVIFGGLYPNDNYNSLQKTQLLSSRDRFMNEAREPGGVPYIDFFSTTGDFSTGHWLSNYSASPGDAGHPNNVGFQKMLDAIDFTMFLPYSSSIERKYQQVSSGACRGHSRTHNPHQWYVKPSDFDGNLLHCQALCSADPSCKAVEYGFGLSTHCELWTRTPLFGSGPQSGAIGFSCFKKCSGSCQR